MVDGRSGGAGGDVCIRGEGEALLVVLCVAFRVLAAVAAYLLNSRFFL